MTCTDGIFVDDRRIDSGDCSGPQSARSVLINPSVDMAVFETARGGILREGLAFDYCDVAVVTNIGEGDHLGLSDINTPEDLAKVKRCIVEAVSPDGPCRPQRRRSAGGRNGGPLPRRGRSSSPSIANHPVIVRHRGVGGRAVFVRDRQIVLAEGDREEVAALARSPALDPKRPDRLPGGKLPGVDRRRLVAGHPLGPDPRPRRIDRRRHRQGARPLQRAGDRRGHGGGRLRPQLAFAGRRDRGLEHVSRTSAARASTRPPATAATATSFARANCWARRSTA